MTDFHFYHLIEIRYGDLDPQGHVNNAKFLTYMEQARVFSLKQLKLWEGGSFLDLGVILADVQITFRKAASVIQGFRKCFIECFLKICVFYIKLYIIGNRVAI